MKNSFKKVLSLVLALSMVLSMLCISANAAYSQPSNGYIESVSSDNYYETCASFPYKTNWMTLKTSYYLSLSKLFSSGYEGAQSTSYSSSSYVKGTEVGCPLTDPAHDGEDGHYGFEISHLYVQNTGSYAVYVSGGNFPITILDNSNVVITGGTHTVTGNVSANLYVNGGTVTAAADTSFESVVVNNGTVDLANARVDAGSGDVALKVFGGTVYADGARFEGDAGVEVHNTSDSNTTLHGVTFKGVYLKNSTITEETEETNLDAGSAVRVVVASGKANVTLTNCAMDTRFDKVDGNTNKADEAVLYISNAGVKDNVNVNVVGGYLFGSHNYKDNGSNPDTYYYNEAVNCTNATLTLDGVNAKQYADGDDSKACVIVSGSDLTIKGASLINYGSAIVNTGVQATNSTVTLGDTAQIYGEQYGIKAENTTIKSTTGGHPHIGVYNNGKDMDAMDMVGISATGTGAFTVDLDGGEVTVIRTVKTDVPDNKATYGVQFGNVDTNSFSMKNFTVEAMSTDGDDEHSTDKNSGNVYGVEIISSSYVAVADSTITVMSDEHDNYTGTGYSGQNNAWGIKVNMCTGDMKLTNPKISVTANKDNESYYGNAYGVYIKSLTGNLIYDASAANQAGVTSIYAKANNDDAYGIYAENVKSASFKGVDKSSEGVYDIFAFSDSYNNDPAYGVKIENVDGNTNGAFDTADKVSFQNMSVYAEQNDDGTAYAVHVKDSAYVTSDDANFTAVSDEGWAYGLYVSEQESITNIKNNSSISAYADEGDAIAVSVKGNVTVTDSTLWADSNDYFAYGIQTGTPNSMNPYTVTVEGDTYIHAETGGYGGWIACATGIDLSSNFELVMTDGKVEAYTAPSYDSYVTSAIGVNANTYFDLQISGGEIVADSYGDLAKVYGLYLEQFDNAFVTGDTTITVGKNMLGTSQAFGIYNNAETYYGEGQLVISDVDMQVYGTGEAKSYGIYNNRGLTAFLGGQITLNTPLLVGVYVEDQYDDYSGTTSLFFMGVPGQDEVSATKGAASEVTDEDVAGSSYLYSLYSNLLESTGHPYIVSASTSNTETIGVLANDGVAELFAGTISVSGNNAKAISAANDGWMLVSANELENTVNKTDEVDVFFALADGQNGTAFSVESNHTGWWAICGVGAEFVGQNALYVATATDFEYLMGGTFVGTMQYVNPEVGNDVSDLLCVNHYIRDNANIAAADLYKPTNGAAAVTSAAWDANTAHNFTVVDAEWELRYALEEDGTVDSYKLPVNVWLGLHAPQCGTKDTSAVDVDSANKVLDLNGKLVHAEGDVIYMDTADASLIIKDTSANKLGQIIGAVHAIKGKLTVQEGYATYLNVDKAVTAANNFIVEGGKFDNVTTTYDNAYDLLGNDRDWVKATMDGGYEVTSKLYRTASMVGKQELSEENYYFKTAPVSHSLTLDQTSASLVSGHTKQIEAFTTLDGVKCNDAYITYKSAADTIATVTLTGGLVTMVSESGNTYVTVANQYGDSKKFDVNPTTTYEQGNASTGGAPAAAPVTKYTVSCGAGVSSNITLVAAGSKVTLTIADGYENVVVKDASGAAVAVTDNTFVMPAGNVTVSVSKKGETVVSFTDVAEKDWFADAVNYVASKGMMEGSDGKFSPNASTSRAMVWAVLGRLDGQTITGASWATDAQAWAVANGISDGTNMNNNVSREELAKMLYSFASYKGYNVAAKAELTNADASSVSFWAVEGMQWAVGAKVLGGDDLGMLNPTKGATRAEVATMLMNFCEKVAK